MGAQGLRDMDDGPEQIDNDEILAQVRKQVRKVYIESIASAALLTVIFAVVPT